MKILALDLSTKSTGWAIFEDKELIKSGCIVSASKDLIKRIHIMTDGINKICKDDEIDEVVVEEVRPETTGSNLQTHRALMWLQAAVAFLLHDNFDDIPITYIYPSSWRSICGIKTGRGRTRETLKKEDIAFVKDKYNKIVNDDEADAIGIGYAQTHPVKSSFFIEK